MLWWKKIIKQKLHYIPVRKYTFILGDPCYVFYLNTFKSCTCTAKPSFYMEWLYAYLFFHYTHHLWLFSLPVTRHLCQLIVGKNAEDSFKTPNGSSVLWLREVGQPASQLHQWYCFLEKLTILTLSIETPWSWSSSSNSSTSSKNMICSRAFSFSRSIRSVVLVTYKWGDRLKENKRGLSVHRHSGKQKCRQYVRNDQPVSACLLLLESLCSLWCMSSHKASAPLWSVLNPFWNSKNTKNFIIFKL